MTADDSESSAPGAIARWETAADVPLLVLAVASIPIVVLGDLAHGTVRVGMSTSIPLRA